MTDRLLMNVCLQKNICVASNFTKFYESLQNHTKITKFDQFLTDFSKFKQIKVQISDLNNFVTISNCCNLRIFFQPNLYPQKSGLTIKQFFPTLSIPRFFFGAGAGLKMYNNNCSNNVCLFSCQLQYSFLIISSFLGKRFLQSEYFLYPFKIKT